MKGLSVRAHTSVSIAQARLAAFDRAPSNHVPIIGIARRVGWLSLIHTTPADSYERLSMLSGRARFAAGWGLGQLRQVIEYEYELNQPELHDVLDVVMVCAAAAMTEHPLHVRSTAGPWYGRAHRIALDEIACCIEPWRTADTYKRVAAIAEETRSV